jgi:hypothetical protein
MDETEVATLEQVLRKSAEGHRPPAPDALVEFIDTVPARERRSGLVGRVIPRHVGRRGVLGLAAAAAVVFALAGTVALMAVRHPTGPAAPSLPSRDGWAWQATDGTVHMPALQVAKGFIAVCGRWSNQALVDQALCSSSDGLHWTTPADPAIVSVDGGGVFLPDMVIERDSVYVATSFNHAQPGEYTGPARSLWRSTDGRHWSVVDSPAFVGMSVTLDGAIADGFVATAQPSPLGQSSFTVNLLISADGLTWSVASEVPIDNSVIGVASNYAVTPAGFYAGGPQQGSTDVAFWRTVNGHDWAPVSFPSGAGVEQLGQVVRLADGSFLGLGSSNDASRPTVMMRSTDGLAWQRQLTSLDGVVVQLFAIGDRLVVGLSKEPYVGPNSYWESDDWGRSWRQLHDLSGAPISGVMYNSISGRLQLAGDDFIVHWVLSPVPYDPTATSEASPAAAPESPVASESVAPTPEPSAAPVETVAPSPEPSATPVESMTPTPEPSVATP